MKTSPEGLALIERVEGCKLVSYRDPAGIWTAGIGHTGPDVHPNQTINEALARHWLAEDVADAEDAVNRLVTTTLTQAQFDALVSWTFNLGAGRLQSSEMLKLINARLFVGAAKEMQRYDTAGGKVLAGLVRRRAAEAALFLSDAPTRLLA